MARTGGAQPDRTLLLRLIDEGYDRKAWHGPNLKGAIRRLTPDQAAWRARAAGRSIAEIVVHCAYWKYAVRRRIRGDKRGSFVLKGSNWFTLGQRIEAGTWREYLALLDAEHAALKEAVVASPWSALTRGPGGGKTTLAQHVYGVALHDVYHAGQIQVIKGLRRNA